MNKLKSLKILRRLANKKDSKDLIFDDEGIEELLKWKTVYSFHPSCQVGIFLQGVICSNYMNNMNNPWKNREKDYNF